jgi:hypothetical protein
MSTKKSIVEMMQVKKWLSFSTHMRDPNERESSIVLIAI